MRDVGADWDFADVRDHYLRELHGVTAWADSDYWELCTPRHRRADGSGLRRVAARARRRAPAASCSGCATSCPAPVWGVLERCGGRSSPGTTFAAQLAPVAVWFVDEGLNGLALHMANDTRAPSRRRCASPCTGTRSSSSTRSRYRSSARAPQLFGRTTSRPSSGGSSTSATPTASESRSTTRSSRRLICDGREISKAFFSPGSTARARGTADELGLRVEAHREVLRSTCASSPPVSFEAFVSSRRSRARGRWVRSWSRGGGRTVRLTPCSAERFN